MLQTERLSYVAGETSWHLPISKVISELAAAPPPLTLMELLRVRDYGQLAEEVNRWVAAANQSKRPDAYWLILEPDKLILSVCAAEIVIAPWHHPQHRATVRVKFHFEPDSIFYATLVAAEIPNIGGFLLHPCKDQPLDCRELFNQPVPGWPRPADANMTELDYIRSLELAL